MSSTVNLCTLDLSKAFDRINHYALFVKLMQRRIPWELLALLEDWLCSSYTHVRWYSANSKYYKINSGVRQGGVLSPYLFAVYIDNLVDRVRNDNVGCIIRQVCASILLYADDIVLIAPSISALQKLVQICEDELCCLDMQINAKKSNCIRIGPRCRNSCVNIVTTDGSVIC